MAQFICPTCGDADCDWPLKPGAAQPVAIVCDYTGGGGTSGDDIEISILCDDNGFFVARYSRNDGNFKYFTVDSAGVITPYVPVGTIASCAGNSVFSVIGCYADDNIEIRSTYNSEGVLISTLYYDNEGNDITGTVDPEDVNLAPCAVGGMEMNILYDDNGAFFRTFYNSSLSGYDDTALDGNLYTPVGGIYGSPAPYTRAFMTDANGVTFIRQIRYNGTFIDYELDGSTPFTPTGDVTDSYISVAPFLACYDGNNIEIRYYHNADGVLLFTRYFDNEGTDITGTVAVEDVSLGACVVDQLAYFVEKLYDDNGVFLRYYDWFNGGAEDRLIDGFTSYVPVGTVYGEPQEQVPTLTDDGTPSSITGVFAIPTNLRAFSIAVIIGPVTVNGITVQTGFTLSREANKGEVLPAFSIDGTGGQILFDSIREV